MDIYLNKEKITCVNNVLTTCLPSEETMEMIVPDALPDILRIVDTDATVFLRSKSTDNGRVSVQGVAAATVIYCPEGEHGVRKLELEIPFTASAANDEITQGTRVTTFVKVTSADASMINPRKIVVRAGLLTNIACYNDAELQVANGVDENNDAGIEIMTESSDIFTTTGIKEKTFVITDELSLPNASQPVGEILKYSVAMSAEDTKVVGSKLILRGSTHVSILYVVPGSGELAQSEFNPEFSQIIELDNVTGESSFNISLMQTNAYFDAEQSPHNPDGRIIIMELHVVAQCVATEKRKISYISDMYSTKYKLEESTLDYPFENRSNSKANAVFHGVLETPSSVSKVIALNVHPGGVATYPQSGNMPMKCPLFVNAIYTSEDGRIMSIMRQYEVEGTAEVKEGSRCSAEATCGKELYGVPVGNGIELRIPVEFNVNETLPRQIKILSGLSYDDTVPLDNSKAPSLVVYRTVKGDSVWKLAKKHQSASHLIQEANELKEDESLVAGQLLIIPKKR